MRIDVGKLKELDAQMGSMTSYHNPKVGHVCRVTGVTLFLTFDKQKTYVELNRKQAKQLIKKLEKSFKFDKHPERVRE